MAEWRYMKNKKLIFLLAIILFMTIALWVTFEHLAENPEQGQRITIKDIAEENIEGYNLFYSNKYIDKNQNKWFDLLYEDCQINDSENTVNISILIYPKYKDSIEFVLYPIINDELAKLTQTGIRELQINQPVVIESPNEYTGYAYGWSIGLIPAENRKNLGVTDDEILKIASNIKAKLIVNGNEEIISLIYHYESM